MMFSTRTLSIETQGNTDIIDLTEQLRDLLNNFDIKEGMMHLFVPGSTMALTTIEFENGLVRDLKEFFEKLVPSKDNYYHNERWGDSNGHSHVRAAMIGPSLSIPIAERKLLLGTWQQVILVDFDTRPRQRELVVQILGE